MKALNKLTRPGTWTWVNRAFGLMGACGVALGAFGAHALKELRTPQQLETWKTATFYLLVHAALGFALSIIEIDRWRTSQSNGQVKEISYKTYAPLVLLLAGTLIFAAALYALVLLQFSPLGAIAPIGGLMMITAWVILAFKFRT